MNIAHVALWTRSLEAQVQFWETVFNGRSNERYVSKTVRGLNPILLPDDGPTLELMTLPDLPDAPSHPEFIGWAHIAINVGSKAKWTAWPSGRRQTARCSAPAHDRGRLL